MHKVFFKTGINKKNTPLNISCIQGRYTKNK